MLIKHLVNRWWQVERQPLLAACRSRAYHRKRPRAYLLHSPTPKVPRGISEPRSVGARIPHALGGVLIGAGVRPQDISRSARAPRRRLLKGAADVDRGRSREAPRGVARMAPGSREKACGNTASRRWRKSTSRSRRRSSAGGSRSRRNSARLMRGGLGITRSVL